jgi:Ca2+-binding EF-hand superfamily protein
MKDLQHVANKCMLIGILAAGPTLAQDIKAHREGIDARPDATANSSKPPGHARQGSNKHFEWNYKSIDTDGDGKISKAEFDSAFAKMDTNGDGYLSSEEFVTGKRQPIEEGATKGTSRVNEGTGEKDTAPKP